MKKLCLRGKVFSGEGDGARFTELPWVKKQIQKKLGFTPYPGTLDMRIDKESLKLKEALARDVGVEILPAPGYYAGKCYNASFKTETRCALVVPEVPGYPRNVVEIIAPENLREKFRLSDGEAVEVKVTF